MSWLNLNQSLSSLKGQITNFASEVLSEGPGNDTVDTSANTDIRVLELEEKCCKQELQIASQAKLIQELEATLHSERLSKKNGIKEDESSWYWDPPSQSSKTIDQNVENQYQVQIRALQDEISTLRERHTIDLRPNTEEELIRLKEENQNLTSNLEDLDSQHQLAMERLLSLKKELQKNFEVLKQEHEDLKNTNDDYSVQIKDLLFTIGERDKEIEHLKLRNFDYDTLYQKYQNLERIHSVLRENAEKFQEENQDLHEEVFKLQEQVTKLEHDIEVSTKYSELSDAIPREKYERLLKELNDIKERQSTDEFHLDEINIDDNAKSVIENLKREISELKNKLLQRDGECLDIAENKIIKTEKIMQLYNKYVNFELPIDYVGEIPAPGDNIVLYKLESVFKTVNSFKKDIDNLEQKISERNLNINHLQTQIEDFTTENDFLTSDIQHFERELNEMKKNNDFLISEIAALKNTSKLEPIIETHEDNLAKLETELADCNRMNKSFESEIQRIEKELSEVRIEKTILQESLTDLKSKYTLMLNELETFKNQTKAVEELENSNNNRQSEKLKDMSLEMDELKRRLSAAHAKNEQLSIDIHIVENDKVLLTKEVSDLKHAFEEKSTAHRESECLEEAWHHRLQDSEKKLDELMQRNNEIQNDKLKLIEQIDVLQNKFNNSLPNHELDKILKEKSQISTQLQIALERNSSQEELVTKLSSELKDLKLRQQLLLNENKNLKNNVKTEEESLLLQKMNDELKIQTLQQVSLDSLKNDNQKLLEKKLQLEAELTSTDTKIVRLEEEFDKLITDLNEKDSLIDTLNSTITQNNDSLSNLTQNVTDLNNTVTKKNQEILDLKQLLDGITAKFNEANLQSNKAQEELSKLHIEKEEISKHVYSLNDELSTKNAEISNITGQIESLEKTCHNYITLIDSKDKEIKELTQSIIELSDKIKTTDNTTHHNDEYATLVEEKLTVENEVTALKHNLNLKETELVNLKAIHDQIEKTAAEYKSIIDNATAEKNELINLVNLKHNESIQYHNEIQRLNHVLLEQSNEFNKIIAEKDKVLETHSLNCTNCDRLQMNLKEKDEIIIALNQNATEYERVKQEFVITKQAVRDLNEKCDNLDKNLAIQLDTVKKLTAENVQLSEQEQNSTRELERLRRHLVETEENYTQELMTSEQKLTECQTRLHQVEERAKQTSTVYTSNSIRANQEVETLRNQIKLLEKQREEVQLRLSDAEDARSRSEAALTNLQVVLEQFQLDKERDIHGATEKIRNKMEDIRRQNNELHDEIDRLNAKLDEASAGLQAATRLGDQVETKSALINDLKEQVRALQTTVKAAEERYYNAISNQQDKVDKNLVKNLVINYVLTAAQNNLNKTQVLRVLSTVLDFNKQECEKLGLVKSGNATDSLAAEFVKFLQNESKPRPPLPNMMGLTQSGSRSTTPTSRKSSTVGSHTTFESGHKRSPSNGSNNLLFQNLDSVETASQRSRESDREPKVVSPTQQLDTGVNQTRNTEGAILKYVLKDM